MTVLYRHIRCQPAVTHAQTYTRLPGILSAVLQREISTAGVQLGKPASTGAGVGSGQRCLLRGESCLFHPRLNAHRGSNRAWTTGATS